MIIVSVYGNFLGEMKDFFLISPHSPDKMQISTHRIFRLLRNPRSVEEINVEGIEGRDSQLIEEVNQDLTSRFGRVLFPNNFWTRYFPRIALNTREHTYYSRLFASSIYRFATGDPAYDEFRTVHGLTTNA